MNYKTLIENYKKYVDDEIELSGIEYIIEETLSLTRSQIYLNIDKEVEESRLRECTQKLDQYCIHRIPAQYVIGHTYFYGLKFLVNPNVLIPRFDTEILVDEVLQYIHNQNKRNLNLIDIGTGSGAIAIALAKNCQNTDLISLQVEAIDISEEALEIASQNAIMNQVDIKFYKSDLLSNTLNTFDIIVSNPPYIDESDKNEGVSNLVDKNEPHLALYSLDHGLSHYKRILDQSVSKLKDDGVLFFEIPDNKCEAIMSYASQYYQEFKVIEDYHHLRRVIKIGAKRK